MASLLGGDWQKQVPSELCKQTAPGLPAPASPLQLDPWDVLEQLQGVLDGRDAEVSSLAGCLTSFAESVGDDGAADPSGQASKTFFGCVRRIREGTLMAADIAFSFQQSGWGNGQGSCALEGLLGESSAGSRLGDCGYDVVRLLRSHGKLGNLIARGRWRLVSEVGPGVEAVDPLLAGLTGNGRVMADAVLAARPRRGLAPSVPTQQVRELLAMLASWHSMGDRVRRAQESADEAQHELDLLGPELRQLDELDELAGGIAVLEAELQQHQHDARRDQADQQELQAVLQQHEELLERLQYWEEQVVAAQSIQAGLSNVRSQVRSHATSLEMAQEDLAEAQAELKHQKTLEANVRNQISGLERRLAMIRGEQAPGDPAQAPAKGTASGQNTADVPPSVPQPLALPVPADLGATPWPAAAAQLLRMADKAIHQAEIFGERDAAKMVQAATAQSGPDSLQVGLAAGAAGVALLLLGVPFKWGEAHRLISQARKLYHSWNGPRHSMVFMLTVLEGAAVHVRDGDGLCSVEAAESAVREAISSHGPDSNAVGDANVSAGLALLIGDEEDRGLHCFSEGLRIKTAWHGPSHPVVALCRAMYADHQRWLP